MNEQSKIVLQPGEKVVIYHAVFDGETQITAWKRDRGRTLAAFRRRTGNKAGHSYKIKRQAFIQTTKDAIASASEEKGVGTNEGKPTFDPSVPLSFEREVDDVAARLFREGREAANSQRDVQALPSEVKSEASSI